MQRYNRCILVLLTTNTTNQKFMATGTAEFMSFLKTIFCFWVVQFFGQVSKWHLMTWKCFWMSYKWFEMQNKAWSWFKNMTVMTIMPGKWPYKTNKRKQNFANWLTDSMWQKHNLMHLNLRGNRLFCYDHLYYWFGHDIAL